MEYGRRYTVALTWVRRHESMVAVLRRLLATTREKGLKIKRVLVDRAFFNLPVVQFLQAEKLPFIMPVVNTAFVILFIYSFGAFDLPYVLGDSFPGMLSLRVYEFYFQRDLSYRPVAMAILTLLFLFSVFFVLLYSWLVDRLSNDVRKI